MFLERKRVATGFLTVLVSRVNTETKEGFASGDVPFSGSV